MTAAPDAKPTGEASLLVKGRLRGGRLVWLSLLAAGLAAASVGVVRVSQWRQRKAALLRVSGALGAYAECMLGAPLAQGESAATRLRRIEAGLPELDAATGTRSTHDAPEEPWPLRCRADVEHAHGWLVDPPLVGLPAIARLDALVLQAIKDPSPTEAPGLLDDLLRAAVLAGATASPRAYRPASSHLAPAPASPLPAALVPPLPVTLHAFPDPLPGVDPLSLGLAFLDPEASPWTCAFNPLHGEPLREVRCAELRRGAVSVLRQDTGRGPGYLRTVRDRFDRFELVRSREGGEASVEALPASIETVALYGDALVWVTAHHWYARTVTAPPAPLGDPVDLGDVAGLSPELEACTTRAALLVAVKTYEPADSHGTSRVMAAREAGAWVRTPGRSVVDVAATFTCEGHAGTWTSFERNIVTQVRCNVDRCETHASPPVSLSWDVGPLYTADLGGRAMLLGLGTSPGPLTGNSVTSVRMRLAPLAAIGSSSDVVLFSDQTHEGALVSAVSVYVRDEVALVLLRMPAEDPLPYRALRVDALGDYAPVIVAN